MLYIGYFWALDSISLYHISIWIVYEYEVKSYSWINAIVNMQIQISFKWMQSYVLCNNFLFCVNNIWALKVVLLKCSHVRIPRGDLLWFKMFLGFDQLLQCGGISIVLGLVESTQRVAFHPGELLWGRSWTSGLFGGYKGRSELPELVDRCIKGVSLI
jgi:hypothetical protein